MKNTLIAILTCIFIVAGLIINTLFINSLKNQLADCRFECNHLQVKLQRCQELSDYVDILEQLPPLVVAQLKTANEMIKQARYRNYEAIEQPLLTEREIDD